MGDWAQIRSRSEAQEAAATPPPGLASPQSAGEPERKKLLAVGLAMILSALAGPLIYGFGLSEPAEPPAAPGLAQAEPRQIPAQTASAPPPQTAQQRASATFSALPA